MAGFEWLGFFGGSLFGKTTYALIQAFAQAEKVALSLVLLGLLRASAALWGNTLYRYPGFFVPRCG